MFKKIINIIKYHNAFAIGFMIVFIGFSTALAVSPELRENLTDALVSEEQTVQSIDNNYVLTADLDNFNFNLQIRQITEDERNYYVLYDYKTIAVQDYVWQELGKEKTMTVSKEFLGNRDLGVYIAEELGEIIDYTLAYLKEVQTIEKEKGLTQKIVTTQYAGLIGVFLEPKEKVFPGYEPVVQAPEPEPADSASSSQELIAYEPDIIQEPIIEELIDESVLEPTIRDNIPPDTILDTHPELITSSTKAIFTFHATKENCEFTCKIDSEFWQGCSSSITYTDLFIGNHQFHVQAIDSANQEDPMPAMFEWQIVETTTTDKFTATTTECQLQSFYFDSDNDSYGNLNNATSTCEQPVNYTTDNTDCNDSDPNINPASAEVCDNIDNNCNGDIDENCPTEPVIDTATTTEDILNSTTTDNM